MLLPVSLIARIVSVLLASRPLATAIPVTISRSCASTSPSILNSIPKSVGLPIALNQYWITYVPLSIIVILELLGERTTLGAVDISKTPNGTGALVLPVNTMFSVYRVLTKAPNARLADPAFRIVQSPKFGP